MWMPAQTTRPPLRTWRSASGTRAPTGANRIAASSGSGGASPDACADAQPSARAKSRARSVAGPGEGVNAPALPGRDLGEDVGGGAEAVEAERLPLPASLSARQPISPAHSKGAAATSPKASGMGKQ